MSVTSKKVVLADVVKVASGQVDPREEPYCDMPHVGGDNIESHTGKLFGLKTARELNLISGKYAFDEHDVLYSKIRPALNKVAAPDFKGICSADIYPIRPLNGKLCREYLVYLRSREIVPLGSITGLVTSGLTPSGGSTVYVDKGPTFIRSQNVQMNRLDFSGVACLPVSIHESMSRTRVAVGDVLLNITGASIGRVAWVEKLPGEANVNQHVWIIRLDKQKATPEFISVFISLPYGQRRIDNMQSGASRQGLNHRQVRALQIPLPPIEMQRQYSKVVSKLRTISAERSTALSKSGELFDSLVQRAFRGEL